MLNKLLYIWKFRLQYCENLLTENTFNPWYVANQEKLIKYSYFKRLVKRSASKKNCICISIGSINLYNSQAVLFCKMGVMKSPVEILEKYLEKAHI